MCQRGQTSLGGTKFGTSVGNRRDAGLVSTADYDRQRCVTFSLRRRQAGSRAIRGDTWRPPFGARAQGGGRPALLRRAAGTPGDARRAARWRVARRRGHPNALTRVVAQLRRELGDDAAEARFIETVPTRGYRSSLRSSRRRRGPNHHRRQSRHRSITRLVCRPGAAPVVYARLRLGGHRPGRGRLDAGPVRESTRGPEIPDGGMVAVDGEPGSIHAASFSPDGRWLEIVSDRTGEFEIYLRDLNRPTSAPVTADGMRNVHPAWSPDSQAIAYHSSLRGGIWVTPAEGGRRLGRAHQGVEHRDRRRRHAAAAAAHQQHLAGGGGTLSVVVAARRCPRLGAVGLHRTLWLARPIPRAPAPNR